MKPTENSIPAHQFSIPLDFNNVPKLPNSHSWTLSNNSDDHRYHQPIDHFTHEPLPIIDLTNPNVFNLIRHACEKWGAFQVINHGIPISFLNETEYQTRRLFSLPMERKLLALRSSEGLTGYGLARISTFFDKLMWSEGFTIIGSSKEHASQLWPEDHSKFCEIMDQYQEEMKKLSKKILAMILGSLGLTLEECSESFEPTNCTYLLQLNSYPVCPDPSRAMGLAPHTDTSLLTLLYQGDISGLQVYKDNTGWVPVEPVEGALVVNNGDLMSIITNGKLKPVLHRVVVNNTRHRVSMAYFHGPQRDAKISPLKKSVDNEHPPLYRQVTWEGYLEIKSKYFSKALESIRL